MMDHFVDEEICPSLSCSVLTCRGERTRAVCRRLGMSVVGAAAVPQTRPGSGACRLAGKSSAPVSVGVDIAKSAEGQASALCQYTGTDAGI